MVIFTWQNSLGVDGTKPFPVPNVDISPVRSFLFHVRAIQQKVIKIMMTPSNGNVFRVSGPLWGEFTGDRWTPRTKASGAFSLICAWTNDRVRNRDACDLRRHRAHYDVSVMYQLGLNIIRVSLQESVNILGLASLTSFPSKINWWNMPTNFSICSFNKMLPNYCLQAC